MISEFRLSGPGLPGMAATPPFDEFIEIYNNSGATHTVQAASGTGYAIASSDGTIRCVIPNTTIILARGHFLCANTTGYSVTNYPGGNLNAAPDATYTTDIPDNVGIALFNNNTGGASFSLANRIDADRQLKQTLFTKKALVIRPSQLSISIMRLCATCVAKVDRSRLLATVL